MLAAVAWLLATIAWVSLVVWVHGDFVVKATSSIIALFAFATAILSRRRFSDRTARNIATIPIALTALLLVRIAIGICLSAIRGYGS